MPVRAQLYLGIKAGGGYSFLQYKNADYLSDNNYVSTPVYGNQVGMVIYYSVNKHLSLQTALNYTQKGSILEGTGKNYVYNAQHQTYLDVPLVFRYSMGGQKLRFYLNIGPHVSYYLSGGGKFSSAALRRGYGDSFDGGLGIGGPDVLSYTLQDVGVADSSVLVIDGFNTLQMGIDLGGGFVIPVVNAGQLFFIDFRYRHTQSHLAQNNADNLNRSATQLPGLVHNYAASLRNINVSIGFVFSLTPTSKGF